MKQAVRKSIITGATLLVIGGAIFLTTKKKVTPVVPVNNTPENPPVVVIPKKELSYSTITLTSTNPAAELSASVGEANLPAVLSLNRVDIKNLQKDHIVVVPDSFDDPWKLSSFPKVIPELTTVPKIMIVAQEIQEFGAYEYGNLVRSGGISTGKKSTPTKSKLYYANWKGKEVISTANDEWLLKWNVNIENFDGIGIHEYELPGYPASHSCIRFSASDAIWFYNWVENWILSKDDVLLARGTPVLVYGVYNFDIPAPWKKLAEDPHIMTISADSLGERVKPLLEEILKKQEERQLVLNNKI